METNCNKERIVNYLQMPTMTLCRVLTNVFIATNWLLLLVVEVHTIIFKMCYQLPWKDFRIVVTCVQCKICNEDHTDIILVTRKHIKMYIALYTYSVIFRLSSGGGRQLKTPFWNMKIKDCDKECSSFSMYYYSSAIHSCCWRNCTIRIQSASYETFYMHT